MQGHCWHALSISVTAETSLLSISAITLLRIFSAAALSTVCWRQALVHNFSQYGGLFRLAVGARLQDSFVKALCAKTHICKFILNMCQVHFKVFLL